MAAALASATPSLGLSTGVQEVLLVRTDSMRFGAWLFLRSPPEPLNILILQIATICYFAHFLIILPLIGKFEKPLPLLGSITAAILSRASATHPVRSVC